MNFFEICYNITHRKKDKGYQKTTAFFTGRVEKTVKYSRKKAFNEEYNRYEIKYYVDGKEKYGWYSFYPLPDPEVEELEEIEIKYNIKKPYIFECVEED